MSQGIDLFGLVADNLHDHAIILLEPDYTVRHWNAAAEQLTGISAVSAIGHKVTLISIPEGAAPRGSAVRLARETGKYEHQGWWGRADGTRFWVEEVITPLLDDGELVGYIDIAHHRVEKTDGTEDGAGSAGKLTADLASADRRAAFLDEASRILAASATNFESAVRSLARLAISRLADGCVVYVRQTDGALTIAEVAHRDLSRQDKLEHLRTDTIRLTPAHTLWSVFENAGPELFDVVSPELIAALATSPEHAQLLSELELQSAMITPLLARGRVIGAIMLVSNRPGAFSTDDLHLAEELGRRAAIAIDNARLYREAQEANRAKADFLAIVSHELRTPLNAIMGYSDLIDTGISGPVSENQRRQIDRIRTSARHLLQIIEEILSYARLESGGLEVDFEETTVGTLADEAAAITEPVTTGKGLAMKVSLPEQDRALITDPAKVRQVLVNLLSNATKFTDRGTVELAAWIDGEYAVYAVRDTGVGMSRDQLERIFDPFWQIERPTTRRTGGTGLGLSVARRFAHLLGGIIRVESTPQVGSTFELRIPLKPRETSAATGG
ncbi:MAG: ATP-binding protein [Gemmatimonadota bacterium]